MNKVVNFFVTAIIILLYCFTSGTISSGITNSTSIHVSGADVEDEGYYSVVSASLNGFALQAETVTSPINTPSFFSFKNPSYGYAVLLKCAEKLFSSELRQNILFLGNFSVKYRKSDLIFPFHYFW